MRNLRFVPAIAATLLALQSPSWSTPLVQVSDLQVIRVFEATLAIAQLDFYLDDPLLVTRLGDPLSETNSDFSFTDGEYYDVFLSNADGVANPLGGYLTIEGVWRQPNLRLDGGMNINEVQLVFGGAGSGIRFGDFVPHFIYGSTRDATFGQNFMPGSEALAVDHNLSTIPRFGQTSTTDLADRFALTISFYGISDVEVPEPSQGWLIVTAFVTASTTLRRWSVKSTANLNLMVQSVMQVEPSRVP